MPPQEELQPLCSYRETCRPDQHAFLLRYSTLHATTGRTPATLFLQRDLQTRPACVPPEIFPTPATLFLQRDLQTRPACGKVQQHDQHSHARDLAVDQKVMARNFSPGEVGFWCCSLEGGHTLPNADQHRSSMERPRGLFKGEVHKMP